MEEEREIRAIERAESGQHDQKQEHERGGARRPYTGRGKINKRAQEEEEAIECACECVHLFTILCCIRIHVHGWGGIFSKILYLLGLTLYPREWREDRLDGSRERSLTAGSSLPPPPPPPVQFEIQVFQLERPSEKETGIEILPQRREEREGRAGNGRGENLRGGEMEIKRERERYTTSEEGRGEARTRKRQSLLSLEVNKHTDILEGERGRSIHFIIGRTSAEREIEVRTPESI